MAYLKEMNKRAENEGQQNVLIMIDGEGNLADTNTENRLKGIENHYKWVEAAHFLGCHAIRVNLNGGKEKIPSCKSEHRFSDQTFGFRKRIRNQYFGRKPRRIFFLMAFG
ncbi:MAG: hypothetical protein U5K51_03445 [Flavobacteriaceae bacterium]|nr:hypothetical protein [Flavobacteriaceae bacterium]